MTPLRCPALESARGLAPNDDGYGWYDRPLIRPFVLARLAFRDKYWHPERKRLARLRALYWWLIRRYDSEICRRCGGPVDLVFHVPDKLWEQYAGFEITARSPGGEAAPGVLCSPCFDALYYSKRLSPTLLYWTCSEDKGAMVG